jgi:hypothetical protein
MNMKEKNVTIVTLAALLLVSCGEKPPPKAPDVEQRVEATPAQRPTAPQVSQELGSIDERAVHSTMEGLSGRLEKCHTEGRGRVEYLSGDLKVFLRVDQAGKVRYGYLEESTIGDHETERCVMDVFSSATWPKPQGGEAEVRHAFGWGPGGERAPAPWGPEKVMNAIDDSKDVKKEIRKCKAGIKGDFIATAYVEHDDSPEEAPAPKAGKGGKPPAAKKHDKGKTEAGKFKALGIVPPGKDGADKVDCLVDALKPLRLPTPGSYAVKVSFPL